MIARAFWNGAFAVQGRDGGWLLRNTGGARLGESALRIWKGAVERAGMESAPDVDAAVRTAGRGVLRQSKRSADISPRLNPRDAALFEIGDNLVGDLLIEAVAVGKGFVGRLPREAWAVSVTGRRKPFSRLVHTSPAPHRPLPLRLRLSRDPRREAKPSVSDGARVSDRNLLRAENGSPEREKREPAPRAQRVRARPERKSETLQNGIKK
jgi:hypothetical protein